MEKIKKWIVVGEDNRPMSFDGDQFCYVSCCEATTRREYSRFPLELYTKAKAQQLMKQHVKYRIERGWLTVTLRLIPVKP